MRAELAVEARRRGGRVNAGGRESVKRRVAAGASARGEYKSGIIKQFRGNRNKTRKSKFQSFSPTRCAGEIARGRAVGWLAVQGVVRACFR